MLMLSRVDGRLTGYHQLVGGVINYDVDGIQLLISEETQGIRFKQDRIYDFKNKSNWELGILTLNKTKKCRMQLIQNPARPKLELETIRKL